MNRIEHDQSLALDPGEVHVWLIDLDQPNIDYRYWEVLLSEPEKARMGRFRFSEDRLRFIARRGILRQLLSRYSGIEPEKITYSTNPFGKLFLQPQSVEFNLTKSYSHIAYAFCRNSVGIDLEKVRPLENMARLINYSFSIAERNAINQLPSVIQNEAFFHVWTQKEAFIKAQGMGLSIPFQDFSVSVDPSKPAGLLDSKDQDITSWKIISFAPEPGWRLSLCALSSEELHTQVFRPNLSDFYAIDFGTSFPSKRHKTQ
jgi:4'-phosphopantetheinyl transferase